MPFENKEDAIKEARKSFQKLTELFDKTLNELLEGKENQARLLIELSKSVSEFKKIQRRLKKIGIEVKAKLNYSKTELVIKNGNTKSRITREDLKFLKNLKINTENLCF